MKKRGFLPSNSYRICLNQGDSKNRQETTKRVTNLNYGHWQFAREKYIYRNCLIFLDKMLNFLSISKVYQTKIFIICLDFWCAKRATVHIILFGQMQIAMKLLPGKILSMKSRNIPMRKFIIMEIMISEQ